MTPSLIDVLRTLLNANVEFVLAGGLAAVAQGAPVTTFDVDIVHNRSEANVDRLLRALHDLQAYRREPTDRRLPPDRAALLGAGHNLFVTIHGPLDCLGAIEGGLDYDRLLSRSVEVDLGDRKLRVVNLETLAELKSQWSDEESKLRAAILWRTLGKQSPR